MNEEQNIKKLPKGWKLSTIPNVVGKEGIFVDGDWIESKDQDPNGDVRLIQLADIGDGNFRNKSSRYLTTKRAKEINCTFLSKGDILVARMPDPIGRACVFPLKGKNKYVTAVDVAIIRPDQEIVDTKFLLYSINSPKYRNSIEKLQSGTTRKRISRKNLSILDFPLPPKSTQQAIVSKIEELFSELDKGMENLNTVQQQLKTYRQSVLKWAFEGKLTNENVKKGELPKGWKWNLINEIGKIKGGKRLPPKHQYSDEATHYVYIMAGNLKEGTVTNKPTYIKEETYNALLNYKVTGGEVYITIVGACIGDAGIIPEKIGKSILTENAAKIIELKNVFNKYLALWINSTACQANIKNKILSATLGKLALNRIGTLKVPIPPLEEQQDIVQAIESRLSVADKMEESITQSLRQAEALRQSILKKAFEGRLVQ